MKKYNWIMAILSASLLLSACHNDNNNNNKQKQQEEQKQDDARSDKEKEHTDTDTDQPQTCPEGFKGENCDECVNGKFGPDCEWECEDPLFRGDGCTECVNGMFGPTCDRKCEDPLFRGDGCAECVNGMFGPTCEWECEDPLFQGDGCTECVNGKFGPDCDWECENPLYKGENCDKCAIDLKTEESGCLLCADDRFSGDSCTECNYDKTYGPDCTPYGTMTDKAGDTYKTTVIDGTTWMSENMHYADDVDCKFLVYDKYPDYIKNFGCLYSYKDAMNICPDGWRLPDIEDFDDLLNYVKNNAATDNLQIALTSRSSLWYLLDLNLEGINEFGFSALPGGSIEKEESTIPGSGGNWWSASIKTLNGNQDMFQFFQIYNYNEVGHRQIYVEYKPKFSVRCLKNKCPYPFTGHDCDRCLDDRKSPESNCTECANPRFKGESCTECASDKFTGPNCDECTIPADPGTMNDRDCNNYPTIVVNGTTWMARNMKHETGKFYYPNGASNNKDNYGLLYDWNTAMMVCPDGWHLPEIEYQNDPIWGALSGGILSTFMNQKAGYYVPNDDPNKRYYLFDAADSSGPARYWTKFEQNTTQAFIFNPMNTRSQTTARDKNNGYSVRCVKD